MPGLVETHFASAGKPDLDDRTPSGLLRLRTPDALRLERQYLGLEIVTHEIEFVPVTVLGRVDRHFCRRQREDQPTVASVHGSKSEDVPQESSVSSCILAVYDYMGAKDHPLLLSLQPRFKLTLPSIPQEW